MKKRKPIFWEKAKKELSRKDPILKKIFSNYKKGCLYPSNDSFRTLCKSIVGQQISVKAADSIWKRLIKTTGKISAKKIDEYRESLLEIRLLEMGLDLKCPKVYV